MVLFREGPYFVKEHSDVKNKYTEDDIINVQVSSRQHFRVFGGKVFQKIVGILRACAPLLADIYAVIVRSGIHTLIALNWKGKVSFLVKLHIQVHG